MIENLHARGFLRFSFWGGISLIVAITIMYLIGSLTLGFVMINSLLVYPFLILFHKILTRLEQNKELAVFFGMDELPLELE